MKTNTIKWLSLSCAFLTLMFFSTSCHKDNNSTNTNMYTISGNASGDQESPVVTTTGSGTLTGTFDASTNALQYTVNWSNLSGTATAAHFHGPAAVGANAGVVVPFTVSNNGSSGTA